MSTERLRWYVVHTHSGYEKKAKASLQQRIRNAELEHLFGDLEEEILIPTEEVVEVKKGEKKSSERKFFPGYMFVSVSSELAPWRSINSTIGVSRLVSLEGKPKPLPLQLISGLMLRCDASGTLLPPKSLNEGDSVEMLTGPFASFVATVDTIDPEQRIWVLMDFMGQKTRMQVTADQLQIAK